MLVIVCLPEGNRTLHSLPVEFLRSYAPAHDYSSNNIRKAQNAMRILEGVQACLSSSEN